MRKIVLALCACAVLLGLGACKERKERLVIGLDDTFAPMGFRDADGNIVGYDVDLARAVTEKLGMELKFKPVQWASREGLLASGSITCIWNGLTLTDSMRTSLACTPPYLLNAQVVVVPAESSIRIISDLTGLTIGLQKGSSSRTAVEGFPGLQDNVKKIVEFSENVSALNALVRGSVDAVVMDEVMADYLIAHQGYACRVLKQTLAEEQYCIAFHISDERLRDRVWQAMLDLRSDGTIRAIDEKWFGVGVSVVAPMQ